MIANEVVKAHNRTWGLLNRQAPKKGYEYFACVIKDGYKEHTMKEE